MKTRIKIEMLNRKAIGLKPVFAHEDDACMDIFAADDLWLDPFSTRLVPSGFKIQLEKGWEAQIRPRSGNSLKKGFLVLFGTIDAGYTGEVGIIIHHMEPSLGPIKISKGDKIAQMAIREVPLVQASFGKIKKDTERGEGGFGSTDKKEKK